MTTKVIRCNCSELPATIELNKSFQFLHGQEIKNLPESDRLAYEQAGFVYWRQRGFPFPSPSIEQLLKEYHKFARSKKSIFSGSRQLKWSPLGFSVANYFHPEMWWTKCERFRTPMEVFNDDEMFRDSIRRVVRLWQDRRPLTPSNIRRILATYVNTKRVSNFRPTVACALFERYSNDGGVILDPAAGYGGRMLGVFPLLRTYIGIEPNKNAYKGNLAMQRTLANEIRGAVELIHGCAEDIIPQFSTSSVDLVIFSPPYFRRERYSNEPNQSWLRYLTYEEWKSGFLERVLQQCQRILRPRGFLILNVANTESHPVANDAKTILRNLLRFHYCYQMMIGSVPYHRNGKHGGFRHEPVYIFRKE